MKLDFNKVRFRRGHENRAYYSVLRRDPRGYVYAARGSRDPEPPQLKYKDRSYPDAEMNWHPPAAAVSKTEPWPFPRIQLSKRKRHGR